MAKIIETELKIKPYFLMLFPAKCDFTHKSETDDVVFVTDIDIKTYIYPVNINPENKPISFLVNASLNNSLFTGMLERAYREHIDIIIGEKIIPWIEYEHIFKDAPFYIPPKTAEVRTTENAFPLNGRDQKETLTDDQN